MAKDIVIGLGEIGLPIFKLLSKGFPTSGYDLDPKLMKNKKFEKLKNEKTIFAHVCIPFSKNFEKNIFQIIKIFQPEAIVIHSTISPGTTEKIQ